MIPGPYSNFSGIVDGVVESRLPLVSFFLLTTLPLLRYQSSWTGLSLAPVLSAKSLVQLRRTDLAQHNHDPHAHVPSKGLLRPRAPKVYTIIDETACRDLGSPTYAPT